MSPTRQRILLATGVLGLAGLGLWWALRPASPSAPASAAATTTVAAAPLHPDVLAVLESPPGIASRAGLILARRLPRTLSDPDIAALGGWLRAPVPAGRTVDTHASFFNEVCNALGRQPGGLPAPIAADLLAIHADPASPDVLRDYALQHLGTACLRTARDTATAFPCATVIQRLRAATGEGDAAPGALASGRHARGPMDDTRIRLIQEAGPVLDSEPFESVATAPTHTWSGTALNMLDLLSREGIPDAPSADWIASRAHALATASDTCEHTRISAYGMLARRHSGSALAQARTLAADAAQSVMLRLAALNYIGTCGDPVADRPLLDTFSTSSDERLAFASREARQQLSKN